ncbi:MAG: AMP-binding protein [Deltaproteobacteria bacterium]|nr:AMP-binding protein [Deltaproteobacteria bacterium]
MASSSTAERAATLEEALRRHAEERPDALALDAGEVCWTWAELHARVDERAAASTPSDGGRRWFSTSSPDAVVELLAGERGDACLVPSPLRVPEKELTRRRTEAARHRGPVPGLLVFTSGTTGEARGVRLSYEALRTSARLVIGATDLRAGDAWLSALPLSHVGGLGVVVRCVLAGATMVVRSAFSPEETARLLGRATHGSFVARMLDRTLTCGVPIEALRVRCLMVGGGPTTQALLARARAAGLPAFATYGMTEAGSTVTLESSLDGASSAGTPLPGVGVRIGEGDVIEVRTPAMMEGYDPPHVTPLTDDGWLRTRDVGRLEPDGRLVVLDRRSDLIVTGGENVAPARVEEVIASHPAVDEVAVLGLPDPSWGQRVVAVVRPRGPVDCADLVDWCRGRLAPYEVPKDWQITGDALPRDPTGKLRRRDVRKTLEASGFTIK